MLKELSDKIIREYNEDYPNFHIIADWGKELADYINDNKIHEQIRWLDNKPDANDLKLAAEAIKRPEVQAIIDNLDRIWEG